MSTKNPTNRCTVCSSWFMSERQAVAHEAKKHGVTR
jgi:hypothetical protein